MAKSLEEIQAGQEVNKQAKATEAEKELQMSVAQQESIILRAQQGLFGPHVEAMKQLDVSQQPKLKSAYLTSGLGTKPLNIFPSGVGSFDWVMRVQREASPRRKAEIVKYLGFPEDKEYDWEVAMAHLQYEEMAMVYDKDAADSQLEVLRQERQAADTELVNQRNAIKAKMIELYVNTTGWEPTISSLSRAFKQYGQDDVFTPEEWLAFSDDIKHSPEYQSARPGITDWMTPQEYDSQWAEFERFQFGLTGERPTKKQFAELLGGKMPDIPPGVTLGAKGLS
jgi:hypothetical protein